MLLQRQLMIWFSFSWLISFFELWNLWISHFMTSRKYSSFLTLSMQTKSIIFCTNVGNWKLMLSIKVMKISLLVSMRLVSKFLNRTMYQLTTISRVLAYSLFTTYKNQMIKKWKMKKWTYHWIFISAELVFELLEYVFKIVFVFHDVKDKLQHLFVDLLYQVLELLSLTVNQNDFDYVWKLFFEHFIQKRFLLLHDILVLLRQILSRFFQHLLGFLHPQIVVLFKRIDKLVQPI